MPSRRWAWVEVDLSAVAHNISALRKPLPPGCRFMAVVKADGYGHGAVEIAKTALGAGAAVLGVATVDEGERLREAGIDAPVMVLAEAPPEAARDVVGLRLTPTVATREAALAISSAASEMGRVVGFHLKIDTGMHRIGVAHDEAASFLQSLVGLPGLRLEGVFTHFATADVPGDWDFEKQLERFKDSLAAVRAAGFDPGVAHAANSAATILAPSAHFDMVRCGIAVYGLHPSEATRERVDLRPAMSVKARVAAVREVGMGEGVSYGLTWRASGPTTIATLPLGYADGIHRVLSGRMRVLLGGRMCEQVGRVCMDQLMVEVPRGVGVGLGDEAVVVGEQSGKRLTLDELAEAAGTINYEMACAFAARLSRRYV
ncbi:MAG: alanine racemase [Coriobacteriia bacterium]